MGMPPLYQRVSGAHRRNSPLGMQSISMINQYRIEDSRNLFDLVRQCEFTQKAECLRIANGLRSCSCFARYSRNERKSNR